VSLTRCGTGTNQALLKGDLTSSNTSHWAPAIALRKGTFIDRPTAMPILSLSVGKNHLDASGSGSKGIAKQVCATGMTFTVTFTDKTDLLFANP
jgi:hypothetical protein